MPFLLLITVLVFGGLIGCGTDPANDTPTVVANGDGVQIQKGEKGDKGDKGDTGPVGPAGKDGIDGKDGKDGLAGIAGAKGQNGADGDPNSTVWKDPMTGRKWTHIQGAYNWPNSAGLCSPWRYPTAAELTDAIRKGLTKVLVPSNLASSDESAWTNAGAVAIGISTNNFLTQWNASVAISVLRVYCTVD